MTIEIRRATIKDVAGIIQVCSHGYRHTEMSQNLTPIERIEASIEKYYNNERVEKEVQDISQLWNGYYVATHHDKVIGAGGGGVSDEETAELYVLYLDPSWKRKGIGTKLLQAITKDQIERGATTQWVTVTKGNQMGIPFYEAVGFEYVEETKEGDWQVLRYKRGITQ